MSKNKQKAGENSTQYLAEGDIYINYGITEARAREIFNELFMNEAKNISKEAEIIASKSIGVFEGKLITKMAQIDDALNSFKSPEFIYLLSLAEKTAMQTEDDLDFDLLTNLIINKIQKPSNKKIGTGIKQAVQILNELEYEALLGLTVAFSLSTYVFDSPFESEVLNAMNDMFSKMHPNDLNCNIEWMDQLDVLKCVRLSEMGKNKKLEEMYYMTYKNSFAKGILLASNEYIECVDMLKQNNIPSDVLVSNIDYPEYYKLNIFDEQLIDNSEITIGDNTYSFDDTQKKVLHYIYSKYVGKESQENAIKQIVDKMKKYDSLWAVRNWWNSMPKHLDITIVGKTIAYSYAKYLVPSIPDVLK